MFFNVVLMWFGHTGILKVKLLICTCLELIISEGGITQNWSKRIGFRPYTTNLTYLYCFCLVLICVLCTLETSSTRSLAHGESSGQSPALFSHGLTRTLSRVSTSRLAGENLENVCSYWQNLWIISGGDPGNQFMSESCTRLVWEEGHIFY